MKNLFLIICMMFALIGTAFADTLTVQWTPPDAREDGTPMKLDEIAGYRVKHNGVEQPDLLTDGQNKLTLDNLTGDQCFQLMTEDTEGRRSIWTDTVCKVAKLPPGTPANVTVEIIIQIVMPVPIE